MISDDDCCDSCETELSSDPSSNDAAIKLSNGGKMTVKKSHDGKTQVDFNGRISFNGIPLSVLWLLSVLVSVFISTGITFWIAR